MTRTAVLVNGSEFVTVTNNQGIFINHIVTGTGIPPATTVAAINDFEIELSNQATADNDDAVLVFSPP